ncbi:hypothetical protein TNCV_3993541 [Trichonephila clavipes]|uniref:Uncharacterized protein n=1 Tax=Trichonephila clavipes TaxID=2585209 RepID=A0A8X6T0D0_TRICX|nr:hypothetical protein TNCV_3993541 [Trichonephila clavipes]
MFTCYKQSSDNAHSVASSQRSSSLRLFVDETYSDIINNLIDYEDGQEEPDSLRVDKNMHGLAGELPYRADNRTAQADGGDLPATLRTKDPKECHKKYPDHD